VLFQQEQFLRRRFPLISPLRTKSSASPSVISSLPEQRGLLAPPGRRPGAALSQDKTECLTHGLLLFLLDGGGWKVDDGVQQHLFFPLVEEQGRFQLEREPLEPGRVFGFIPAERGECGQGRRGL
jgi:hypothetical protein